MTEEQKVADDASAGVSDSTQLLGRSLPKFYTIRKCSQCGNSDELIRVNGCPERCGRKVLTECPVCYMLLDENEILGSCLNTSNRLHRQVEPNAVELTGALKARPNDRRE